MCMISFIFLLIGRGDDVELTSSVLIFEGVTGKAGTQNTREAAVTEVINFKAI